MDAVSFNREAWDKQVGNNPWTVPVTSEEVAAARAGDWKIVLTPTKPVPPHWYPQPLAGKDVLCLASGGGQQGPILAAAGAVVTVLDNSPRQLAQDRLVAERDGLNIRTVQGKMTDLSAFANESFDLIVHPVSNIFSPEILPVWRECYRVLRPGGALMCGIALPHLYCLDLKDGTFFLRFPLPYSDLESISTEEREQKYGADTPVEFSHTLEEQIGGQLAAGFVLVGYYEDSDPNEPLSKFFQPYFATLARKLP